LAEIRCVEKRETTKKRRKILQKNKFKKDEREKFERGRERGRGKERGINHKSIRVEVTHSTTLLLARASLSLSLSLCVFGFAGARSTKRDDEGALSRKKKKEEYYRRRCDEKSVVVLVFVEDDFDEICGRGGLCPRRGQWGIGERRARVVWWSEHRERGADDHHEESRLAGGFGRHEQ
jgi:hypothetical protein